MSLAPALLPLRQWLASRAFTVPLTAFVITRALVLLGAYLPGMVGINLYPDAPEAVRYPPALAVWARWDANWYVRIAEQGYSYQPGEQSAVAFFPVYPLAMRVVSLVTGNALLAGLLLSNGCFLAALVLFYRLVAEQWGAAAGERAVFYLAVFPAALFFSAVYTESLFLLLSLIVVAAARRRQWWLAGAVGALAAGTRVTGVLLTIVVAWEWLAAYGVIEQWAKQIGAPVQWVRARGLSPLSRATDDQAVSLSPLSRQVNRQSLIALLGIALIPAGLLAFMLYLQIKFGDALLFLKAQDDWSYGWIGPLGVIQREIARLAGGEVRPHVLPFYPLVDIAAFGAVLLLYVPIARRMNWGYALYCALAVLLPMSSRAQSMIRYMGVLFPAFVVLALWGERRQVDRSVRWLSLPLLCMLTALFVNWVFIG